MNERPLSVLGSWDLFDELHLHEEYQRRAFYLCRKMDALELIEDVYQEMWLAVMELDVDNAGKRGAQYILKQKKAHLIDLQEPQILKEYYGSTPDLSRALQKLSELPEWARSSITERYVSGQEPQGRDRVRFYRALELFEKELQDDS